MKELHIYSVFGRRICILHSFVSNFCSNNITGTMILSSKYIQIIFLVLVTKSIRQSSEVKIDNTEVVRQRVGSFGTELILEEISQVWLLVKRGYYYCQAPVQSPVPQDLMPIPNPKQSKSKVQLGLGVTQ